jgi:signal transduction histidine kinase
MAHVLLVEDSLGDAELVRLRAAGTRGGPILVEVAETLEEGIALAQRQPFDAVLLDLGLPDSTGLSTIEEFRKALPRLPIIVFTGLDDLDTAINALRVGADDYLVKGELNSETLRRSVSYAGERRKLLDRSLAAVEARDEILRIVSHDMRNQMSTVLAGLALMRSDGEEKRARRIDQVERAAMTLRRLIGDLLDIDALEKGSLKIASSTCDAGSLLQSVFHNFAPAAERLGMRLEARSACAGLSLHCDSERVQQVLGNFISNALKFTPPGGVVVLGCEGERGQVRMFVQDSGPGIAEAEAARVFDRFFRGSQSRGDGLGLGLTIARALIQAHGGEIGVTTRTGAGARFWFTLPLAQG